MKRRSKSGGAFRDRTRSVPLIGKVLRGTRAQGLVWYLYGPGRREEHRDPHLVAFSPGPQPVARRCTRCLAEGFCNMTREVWCSVSLLIRSPASAEPPHVQQLAWRRRVVDHGLYQDDP